MHFWLNLYLVCVLFKKFTPNNFIANFAYKYWKEISGFKCPGSMISSNISDLFSFISFYSFNIYQLRRKFQSRKLTYNKKEPSMFKTQLLVYSNVVLCGFPPNQSKYSLCILLSFLWFYFCNLFPIPKISAFHSALN